MKTSRREFLTITTAGLSIPTLVNSAILYPHGRLPKASGGFTPPGMLDYLSHPVIAKDPQAPQSWYNVVESAFDGYGGSLKPDSIARCWTQTGIPSERQPFSCTIDYGAPVAISKFVHYFYKPSVRDYRTDPLLLSTAFRAVNIYRSDDGINWYIADRWEHLAADWPQVLTLSAPASARHYKIEVVKLVTGAQGIRTYEIESVTGPVIHNPQIAAKNVKAGEPFDINGNVVARSSSARYRIVIRPSKAVKQLDGPSVVEPDGSFRLRLIAFQPGLVAATLRLQTEEGVTIDERTLTSQLAPRVRAQEVRVQTAREKEGQLTNQNLDLKWAIEEEGQLNLSFTLKNTRTIESRMVLTYNGEPIVFTESNVQKAKASLFAAQEHQTLEGTLELKNSALCVRFRIVANGLEEEQEPGVLTLRLRPQSVRFRFVPAYVYSREPVRSFVGVYGDQSLVRGAWFAPTRMVGLETRAGTVGLVPDRDRCLMGVDLNDAVVTTRVGQEPVEVLIPVISGDWFELFRYVVRDIYKFSEPKQFEPLTKCVSGRLQYLTLNEDNWSTKMQVLTSFPRQDYVFVFYGLTYTIPALYSWYLASGDTRALERARKCVGWLTSYPGVRITEGATAGAFFSQFISPKLQNLQLGSLAVPQKRATGGCDQALNRWLEPHATGAAAWTLLHYYIADGKRDDKALAAARAALDWLLKTQDEDGGWAYAYHVDGTKVTDQQDSGNIWNIWALSRYGKLTGQQRYLAAAERAKQWFASKYIANHSCHGYWEDVSGGAGRVRLSWEGYDFAIAAVAFADMGEPALAVAAAKNAVTWIWTRTIACRNYFNSYGHVHEQWGWPPATYLAPMFGLAAQAAFQITGDDFFRQFAGAAKTIGWWTVRETDTGIWPQEASRADLGGSFWPLEATEFVPLEEPFLVTFWVDWISSQQATICLTWLIHEVNLRSGGKIQVDPMTLKGNVLGELGKVVVRADEPKLKAAHTQFNWLTYRTNRLYVLALLNYGARTDIEVKGPLLQASKISVLSTSDNKHWREKMLNPRNVLTPTLPARGAAIIGWHLTQD